MVMKRFYQLYDALSNLYSSVDPDEHCKFCKAFDGIKANDLAYAINLLSPLVEAIDKCQQDNSSSVDGFKIVKGLRDYYSNITIPGFDKESVNELFDKRMELFSKVTEGCARLFSLPISVELSEEEKYSLINKCISEICNYSIKDMTTAQIKNRASFEVPEFLKNADKRDGVSIPEFFSGFNATNRTFQFMILPTVYDIVMSQCASSASVERSFSEQGLIQTTLRNRLKYETLSSLMIIKCNLKFLQRQNRENNLREYLKKNNPIKK